MERKINVNLLVDKIKKSGISLHQLSRETGISVSHLSMMFSNKRNITVKKLNKILEVTHINIKDISE